MLLAAMVLNRSASAYASYGPGDTNTINTTEKIQEKEPEDMTAAEIISILYEAETNADIRQCAIDSSTILCGEGNVVDYYGTIYIGTYDSPAVYNDNNISVILGDHDPKASINDNKYTMLLSYDDYPTEEKTADNKNALILLYKTVQELKTATNNMSAYDKAVYLTQYLDAMTPQYVKNYPDNPATCLKNGMGDCGGFAGLYYIVALNCGLDVKLYCATMRGEPHVWNAIYVDGVRYFVDLASNVPFFTEAEAVSIGYTFE